MTSHFSCLADLITIPSQTAANREAEHPALCRKEAEYGTCRSKNLNTACPCSQLLAHEGWRLGSFTRLAALTLTCPTTDIEAYRCGKPLCHRKRYCPQICKHLLVCQHLHYMVGGRWRCSVHHLGPHPGSKLRREVREYLDHANKNTENMTTTQILLLNTSLLNGASWVNTSLITAGVLKI